MRHRLLSIILTLLLTAGTATSVFAAQTLPAGTDGEPAAVEETGNTVPEDAPITNDSDSGATVVETPSQEPEETPAVTPQSDPQEPAAEPQTDPEQPSADAEVPSGNNAGGTTPADGTSAPALPDSTDTPDNTPEATAPTPDSPSGSDENGEVTGEPETPETPEEPETPAPGWSSDKQFYYNTAGVPTKGFFRVDNVLYYADRTTGVVRHQVGFFQDGSYRYYVQDTSGSIAYSKTITVGQYKYRTSSAGTVKTGVYKWGNYYWYANAYGALWTNPNFANWNGHWYHIQKGGTIAVNKKFKYGNYYYVANADGTLKTGVFKWGDTIYYANSRGAIRTAAGFITWNGKKYYVAKGGSIKKACTFKVGGYIYRAYSDGHLATGIYKWGNKLWYANSNGLVRTVAGFFTYNGKKYYNEKGGGLRTSAFVISNDKYYYMNSDGTLRLTTMSANGVKLHPDPKTGVIPTSEYLKAYPSPYNYQKYILVDISNQTLKYYEHGKVVLSCKVVTGNVANGTTTPTGKYKIFFKKKNVDLVGADYVSHVSYWMEFASGGYGMHDATWRSSFGGTIYKYNGSHGCVNMPYSSAAKLYSLAAVGTIVIVQR